MGKEKGREKREKRGPRRLPGWRAWACLAMAACAAGAVGLGAVEAADLGERAAAAADQAREVASIAAVDEGAADPDQARGWAERASEMGAMALELQASYEGADDEALAETAARLQAMFPGGSGATSPWGADGKWSVAGVSGLTESGLTLWWSCSDGEGLRAVASAAWDPETETFSGWRRLTVPQGGVDGDDGAFAGAVAEVRDRLEEAGVESEAPQPGDEGYEQRQDDMAQLIAGRERLRQEWEASNEV